MFKALLHNIIFSCNLQRNDDESMVRQVAEDMLHTAEWISQHCKKLKINGLFPHHAKQLFIVRQVVKRVRNFVRNLSCNGLHCKLLKKIVSCSSPLSCLENLNLLEDVLFYLMLRFKDFFPALVTLPMIQVEVQNTFTLE